MACLYVRHHNLDHHVVAEYDNAEPVTKEAKNVSDFLHCNCTERSKMSTATVDVYIPLAYCFYIDHTA